MGTLACFSLNIIYLEGFTHFSPYKNDGNPLIRSELHAITPCFITMKNFSLENGSNKEWHRWKGPSRMFWAQALVIIMLSYSGESPCWMLTLNQQQKHITDIRLVSKEIPQFSEHGNQNWITFPPFWLLPASFQLILMCLSPHTGAGSQSRGRSERRQWRTGVWTYHRQTCRVMAEPCHCFCYSTPSSFSPSSVNACAFLSEPEWAGVSARMGFMVWTVETCLCRFF